MSGPVTRYLTASLELNPTTIYSGEGDCVLVSVVLTETTNVDITADTVVMGVSVVGSFGSTPSPPAIWYPPDTSTQLSAAQRLVGLQVGYNGTINPVTGSYVAWVMDTAGETITTVPCLNQTFAVVNDVPYLDISGGLPANVWPDLYYGGSPFNQFTTVLSGGTP